MVTIEIRHQQPKFSRAAIAGYIRGGIPPSLRTPITWPAAKKVIRGRVRKEWADGVDSAYLLTLLSPEFHFDRHGLYLHGAAPHGIMHPSYVREHGIFTSEGTNNHVHLPSVIKSPVGQFELGVRAVRSWANAVREFPSLDRAVIYLTGAPRHWLLCIYSNPSSVDLANLEARMPQSLTVTSFDKFEKWAV